MRDRAKLKVSPTDRLSLLERYDYLAVQEANRVRDRDATMTGLTNTYSEAFYINNADASAVATTASEASLLTGLNNQPVIPANWWLQQGAQLRTIEVIARGVMGTTSTPTLIFQARLGATSGATFLSGTSVGVSAAISCASGVSNKWWELRLLLTCRVSGIGTANATLSGAGVVTSPGGFASPFIYPLEPSTPDTATWTSTLDNSVTQYLNLSVTWGTSSASNTIQLKQLIAMAHG